MRQFKNACVGDTIKVQFKIVEEGSERLQLFEGTLMRVRGSNVGQTITVRKISFGVGIERIFPVASPRFVGLQVIRRGKVRRSKLYYLRGLTGKADRIKFKEGETTPPGSAPAVKKTAEKVVASSS